MGELALVASKFLQSALAPSSRAIYAKVADQLRTFTLSHFDTPHWFPATPQHIIMFISDLLARRRSPATVTSALSSLSYLHKLYDAPDPTAHFLVRKIVLGASKSNPQTDLRAPINPTILSDLMESLRAVCSSAREVTLFRAMFSLMFYGFLRVGEVTDSQNNITLSQVEVSPSAVTIKFVKFKHHQGLPKSVLIREQGIGCPVKALSLYMAIRGSNPGPFFADTNGRPVSSFQFSDIFKRALGYIGLDSAIFKPHSFRIGAATHAFLSGTSMDEIQQMGRWKSQAFRKYIRVDAMKLS